MAEPTVTDCEIAPCFDLEHFMSACQETRINGEMMQTLADVWDRWLPLARARRIQGGGESCLLVWLPELVEKDVDEKWAQSPSEAFLFNVLAQVMCMGIIHSLLPQVEDMGCAPAPRPTDLLASTLEDEGVPYLIPGEPGLARRYAVMTHYPYKGGCETCALLRQCPKSGGGLSVTLPGHEPSRPLLPGNQQ